RGDALEEQAPAREQVSAIRRRALLEAKQVREARLDQAPLALLGNMLLDGRLELPARRRCIFLLDDPRSRSHHLRQRPVGDAFAVGETATLVPAHHLLDPVYVLEELPDQAGLARAGLTDDRHQPGAVLCHRGFERLDDQRELAVAPHERGLESGAAARTA